MHPDPRYTVLRIVPPDHTDEPEDDTVLALGLELPRFRTPLPKPLAAVDWVLGLVRRLATYRRERQKRRELQRFVDF